MKKRINISIDEYVFNKVRGHIVNLSLYIERCLVNKMRQIEMQEEKERIERENQITQDELKKLYADLIKEDL